MGCQAGLAAGGGTQRDLQRVLPGRGRIRIVRNQLTPACFLIEREGLIVNRSKWLG